MGTSPEQAMLGLPGAQAVQGLRVCGPSVGMGCPQPATGKGLWEPNLEYQLGMGAGAWKPLLRSELLSGGRDSAGVEGGRRGSLGRGDGEGRGPQMGSACGSPLLPVAGPCAGHCPRVWGRAPGTCALPGRLLPEDLGTAVLCVWGGGGERGRDSGHECVSMCVWCVSLRRRDRSPGVLSLRAGHGTPSNDVTL